MSDKSIYTDSLAECIRASGDKKYRPSNGSEGEMFMERWCYQCRKDNYPDGDGCEIIVRSMGFAVDEEGYPAEWTFDEGQPCCTAFEQKEGK